MDPFHQFGSTWYCLEMRGCMEQQRKLLKQLLDREAEALAPLKPLVLGVVNAAQGIALCWPERLLSEAHVLMRLFVERAITLCCMAVSTPAEFQELFRSDLPEPSGSKPSDELAYVISHAKAFGNFGIELLSRTEQKLAFLESKSTLNANAFRLSVAMHFPIALAALSGSPAGAICHLHRTPTPNPDSYFQEEFSGVFMEMAMLINEVLKAVATIADIKDLISLSDAAQNKTAALIQRIKEPVAPNVAEADGWWAVLPELEHTAKSRIQRTLDAFEPAFRLCADLGVQVPALPTEKPRTESAKVSALFLKRVLNDLRGVWILLNFGYPSQAASIAASLFENAAIIQCIAGNVARAAKVSKNPFDKLPWDNAQMCKFILADDVKRGQGDAPSTEAWKYHYAQYSWLCEIKHPTLHQTIYDAGATALGNSGYAVMTYPDVREDNVGTKRTICFIALTATERALQAFARERGVKNDSAGYRAFASRIEELGRIIETELKSGRAYHGFGILDSKWARKNISPSPPKTK
jgi:hypothetical protein